MPSVLAQATLIEVFGDVQKQVHEVPPLTNIQPSRSSRTQCNSKLIKREETLFIPCSNSTSRLACVHVLKEATKVLGLFQPYPLIKSKTKIELEGSTKIFWQYKLYCSSTQAWELTGQPLVV